MPMRPRRFIAAIILSVQAGSVEAASNLLSPDDIKAAFGTGKPFSAVSTSGMAYSFTFKPDGSALQVAKGKKKGTAGSWHVSDKGYCTTWGTGKEHCYTVETNGNKYNVRGATGQLISTWTR